MRASGPQIKIEIVGRSSGELLHRLAVAAERYEAAPEIVEALQWDGQNDDEVRAFIGDAMGKLTRQLWPRDPSVVQLVGEVEGDYTHDRVVGVGDWVVKCLPTGVFKVQSDATFREKWRRERAEP